MGAWMTVPSEGIIWCFRRRRRRPSWAVIFVWSAGWIVDSPILFAKSLSPPFSAKYSLPNFSSRHFRPIFVAKSITRSTTYSLPTTKGPTSIYHYQQLSSVVEVLSNGLIGVLSMRLCHHSTRFILISTQHNENVGAAARAIKTMGFDDLALVSPRDKKVLGRHKVIQMSSGAIDVLRTAKIYTTLHEAIEDRDVVCGTGMPDFDLYRDKSRVVKLQHVEPRVYFDELLQSRCYKRINIDTKDDNEGTEGNDDQAVRLAIVFGSEQTGEP